MLDNPEPDCWLHPDVEVRPSSIAGEGLFARAPIAAGMVVSRLGGHLVTWPVLKDLLDSAARQPDRPYIDTIAVTETLHLVLPPGRPNGKGNHSCEPNLWWVDAYILAARRDIKRGEELTNDYGTSTAGSDFRMPCRCRSALCRGVVTGGDWQLAELRRRYGMHWVPALLELISRHEPPCQTDHHR
ncbi:SET domain-containing protein [Micromonospora sp. NPDC093277]|uniref:SET domain-containing protein n=1 Tax=Micromonospora sp. NPDC093277 TaxID=3364291 RepID=UPI003807DC4E